MSKPSFAIEQMYSGWNIIPSLDVAKALSKRIKRDVFIMHTPVDQYKGNVYAASSYIMPADIDLPSQIEPSDEMNEQMMEALANVPWPRADGSPLGLYCVDVVAFDRRMVLRYADAPSSTI